MVKLWIGTLLALTAVNSIAGNMYVYKDKGKQVLLTKVTPNGEFDKFTKKVKVTYPSDSNEIKKHRERLMTDMANELILAEEKLLTAKIKLEKHNLKMYSELRKKKRGNLTPNESQIILDDGKDGFVDIGAKINMTHNQVLKNTYWGKADRTHTITDEYGKLDYWSYERYGVLIFDNDKLIIIDANPIID